MDPFHFQGKEAYCEAVPLSRLAKEVGTPAYIYSAEALNSNAKNLTAAFRGYPTQICFAVKANSNLGVLKTFFQLGLGADIVSGGELERAIRAGADPAKVVFSGVGKQREEIEGALNRGIYSFNVESPDEIQEIDQAAQRVGRRARISLRINPNIDVKTNPHIATGLYSTKFGIAEPDKAALVALLGQAKHTDLIGLACHIGSQLLELKPFQQAAARMAELAKEMRAQGHRLESLDLGGGLGIRYEDEAVPTFDQYAHTLISEIRPTGLKLWLETGRCLVGNAGILLTRVIRVKATPQKTFVVIDAAMNDLIRPCLYDAYHRIEPVLDPERQASLIADVVGPICESADFLGKDRKLPQVSKSEVLFIRGCGAYASSMASNYNSRPRAPEVLVEGANYRVLRRRETFSDLWACETND